jgi:hypothetical protein
MESQENRSSTAEEMVFCGKTVSERRKQEENSADGPKREKSLDFPLKLGKSSFCSSAGLETWSAAVELRAQRLRWERNR